MSKAMLCMPVASISRSQVDPLTDRIRRFNRFYTDLVGSLQRKYLGTPLSLPEARVVYEVATRPGITGAQIRANAHYDQGHLSRILARLEREDVIVRAADPNDRRAHTLQLTTNGQELFDKMQQRARAQVNDMVDPLTRDERERLLESMTVIERLLDPDREGGAVTVRDARPGDVGILLHRHTVQYREEFQYDERFERYVAQGIAPYLENHDPERDRLWIAEQDGRQVGSIAIHHDDDRPGWAKLRWYLVDPSARGHGLGRTLIRTAIEFSKQAGYQGIFLWTVNNLDAARRQYERAGFRLTRETDTCPWAPWAKEQLWEMELED